MNSRFFVRFLALTFAGCLGWAAAQETNPGQGSPPQQLNLNQAQKQSIANGLRNEQPRSDQTGSAVATQQLPNSVTDQVPQVKGYYFIKTPDKLLLLDPDSKTVVEIVAEPDTNGSANDSPQDSSESNR
jgi:hypothetical protein